MMGFVAHRSGSGEGNYTQYFAIGRRLLIEIDHCYEVRSKVRFVSCPDKECVVRGRETR